VLSNIICLPLDYALSSYCENNQITYTRYADDLSFSSNKYFSEKCISEIRQIIKEQQFAINEKKFRINSRKSQQKVTGLVVNNKVNVDRTYIKTLRACLHNWKLSGLEHAAAKHYCVIMPSNEQQTQFVNKLKGQIEFIGMVRGKEDKIYLKLRKEEKSLSSCSVFHY
jgi:RNA-directed DNA polymerase